MNKQVAAVLIAVMSVLMAAPAEAASSVRFSNVQYDSPGKDTGSLASLNAEWIRISNHGSRAVELTGWTVRDKAGHVFRFPQFTLKAGRSVRVHTGPGRNTATDLHWGSHAYIWNNTGDRAALKNRALRTVDLCRWGDGDGSTAC